MRKIGFLFVVLLIAFASYVYAGKINEGTYRQTSVNPSDWGDCPKCTITITKETPHAIRIVAKNGWIGYAIYDKDMDRYAGSWEWKQGRGGAYAGEVFDCVLFHDGKVITMDVKSQKTGRTHSIT